MTTTSSPRVMEGLQTLLRSKDLVMALAVVLLVALLIVPLPSFMIDLLVILNLGISIGVIMLTMYVAHPMDFSVFPTLLLFITLLRLGINVASSRQILLNGEAGNVIATFGNVLVGGNYVVGIVIFVMLMIIQFSVINSGAGRVAEVAARFTLDAMPGKQLAIDADLNAGLIDEMQARERRKAIEKEADFYGSMDGATKFVRGDALAAIIIMLVNVIGGVVIGILQRGLPVMDALQSYALLTVGAGLAIQVPALLVSAGAGLIVTRSTSDQSLANEIFGQVSNFNSLAVGAIITGLLVLVPGLPKIPVLAVAVALGGAAFYVSQMQKREIKAEAAPAAVGPKEPETPEEMMEMVVVDPIELEIGYGLIPLVDENSADNLLRRITGIRRQIMSELGFVLPVVRIRDNLRLQPQVYRLKMRGQEAARGELLLDRVLAIPGSDSDEQIPGIRTTEPAFGLPAIWILEADRGRAELMGYTVVNPLSVISTHVTEIIRNNAWNLLSRQMVQEMLNQLRQKAPATVEGVVPELITLGEVQLVLRNLLRERVPIRDLTGILETLANNIAATRDTNILSEAVRQNMSQTISSLYRDESNILHVFTLSPQVESLLRNSLSSADGSLNFQIDAATAQRLLTQIGRQMEEMARLGYIPILLCPRELRLALRRLVEPSLTNLIVLAFSEVGSGTRVNAHGMVDLAQE
ncbi:MAG TPA: flagellar biosynthesis protein FlhA [Anaerolineaceae bacterium]